MVKSGATTYAEAAQNRIMRSKDELEMMKALQQKNKEIDYLRKQVEDLERRLDAMTCPESSEPETEMETDSKKKNKKKKKKERNIQVEVINGEETLVIKRGSGSKKHKRPITPDGSQQPPKKSPPGEHQSDANQTKGAVPKQFNKPGNKQDNAMDIELPFGDLKLQPTTSVSN